MGLDISGERYGMLVAKSPTDKKRNGNIVWNVVCDCGKTTQVSIQHLRQGNTKSCGCSSLAMQMANSGRVFKDREMAAFNLTYADYKQGAKKRGYSFEITKTEFYDISQQPCHYCGDTLSNTKKVVYKLGGEFKYNGLDRVDNTKGYTLDNVVPCCGICNVMKMTLEYDDFIDRIHRIAERHSIKKKG